jgi:mannose-6-phosphate isomerase
MLTGPAIALCAEGELTLSGIRSSVKLSKGESVYVTPDEGSLAAVGSGTVFIATTV